MLPAAYARACAVTPCWYAAPDGSCVYGTGPIGWMPVNRAPTAVAPKPISSLPDGQSAKVAAP